MPASNVISFAPEKFGYVSETNLFTILPSTIRDQRYQGALRVKVFPTVISQGTHFCAAPCYQTQRWTVSVHPEGKRYAHNKLGQGLSVVTEADVADPEVAEQIEGWLSLILARATEGNVHLSDSSDLFLEVEPDSGGCNYWFADHAQRTIFWLHHVDTQAVGLPNTYSRIHLQYALEENYWTHVEMFPATASKYSITALNELRIILLHAKADALTSDLPTFPYTAEECGRFIGLLHDSIDQASNPYITTYIARLWVVVANHRFFTHFGENHCRMSAVQPVLELPGGKRPLILRALSKALFDLPNAHRVRLEKLWVDELVYASSWRKHVSERVEELRLKMIWIFALTMTNILIMPISYIPTLNKSSILLCILGLCNTLVLYKEQRQLVGTGGSTGAAYLDARNTRYGFEPTAIVHSLPEVAFVWAFFLFTIQGFWMTFGDLPTNLLLPIIIPVGVVIVVAGVCVWVTLRSPAERAFEDATTPVPPVDQKDTPTADGMV